MLNYIKQTNIEQQICYPTHVFMLGLCYPDRLMYYVFQTPELLRPIRKTCRKGVSVKKFSEDKISRNGENLYCMFFV